ncbi:type IX secretion system sortase PorU [Carboxylicivirga sp. N1Y90]|uniref:type IX secretion system sortase PorU n=1 Tax=Carboxylicivirga fragile TaxID=3417571 RepID=UPI003D33E7D8|nr:type IX secretion system sortase PorU [Marinilabiliaceae bacterium N1Y90]
MSKLLYILSFLILSINIGEAQVHHINETIDWKAISQTNNSEFPVRLEFDQQSGWNGNTQLPVITYQIPLNDYSGNIDSIKIDLRINNSSLFNPFEQDIINSAINYSFNNITKYKVQDRKSTSLEIELTPISFDEKLQLLKKITQYSLHVTIPPSESSKSNFKSKKSSKTIENSILAQGKWIKISIDKSGIYTIPYSVLNSWGFSDGSKVNVFGNGGNMLPKSNSIERLEDLTENATLHENNAIYFYAQGPITWEYNQSNDMFQHQLHDYVDEAYYYLSDDNGVGIRVEASSESHDSFTHETSEFDSYDYYELEARNLLHSGRTWYGLDLYPAQEREYNFKFDNIITSKPVKILTSVIGHSNQSSHFETHANGTPIQSISIPPVRYEDSTGSIAHAGTNKTEFDSNDKNINIKLSYHTMASGAFGNLNFITLNSKENLQNTGNLLFRNNDLTGLGNISRFYIEQLSNKSVVWDISNHVSPIKLKVETYSDRKGITTETSNLKEFAVFNTDASLPQPTFVKNISNQNLRGNAVPEMLIVSHPIFLGQAERLAELHQRKTGLKTLIVTPEQVYNEFSSGQADVSAIRDFARFLYNKDNEQFKYLLLFGDGSYDNRDYSESNSNFILTYQSVNSINISATYCSDDYYGFLDNDEGENILTNKLDIGIGRLPVGTVEEATTVVDKIETYLFSNYLGSWKSKIMFVADDGDNNLHMRDADRLTQKVASNYPQFSTEKIYSDAYKKNITASGDRYPDVNAAIQHNFSDGALIFNYTGHGGEKVLAHEHILTIPEIVSMSNFDRLPIFVTATCEFSRYDDKNYEDGTAGEIVLKTPNGGGIALFTTTRIAWSNSNYNINNNLYDFIFEHDEEGNKLRLGDIIRQTKNKSLSSVNKVQFTLLGDPALQLAYPSEEIRNLKINGEIDSEKQDTLKAFTKNTVEGVIGDGNQVFSDGTVEISVFDKPVMVKTLGNGGATPFEYEVYQNRIFKGQVDAQNNSFETSFIIPKDIRFNVDFGRISYYASDKNGIEAFGANNQIKVGGISSNPPNDTKGPEINMWLNNPSFSSGGTTGTNPILHIELEDESGINTSGVGIGHDLSLIINGDRSKTINLNSFYISEKNDYKKGSLKYQLPKMEEGRHIIEHKAWDNLNNSSTKEIVFNVEASSTLNIEKISLRPNPVKIGNTLEIYFEHDAPNSMLRTTTSLYTLDGRIISSIDKQVPSFGNSITPIQIQLPKQIINGLYILTCDVTAEDGQIGRLSEKILIIK